METMTQAWARPTPRERVVEFVRPKPRLEVSQAACAWLHGQLVDVSQLALPSRLEVLIRRWLRMPMPSWFYDIRGVYGSREEARANCTSSDSYIVAIPYGRSLGNKVAESKTFCRPKHSNYGDQDARDRLTYRGDLSDTLCAETEARLRELNDRLGKLLEN